MFGQVLQKQVNKLQYSVFNKERPSYVSKIKRGIPMKC